MLIIIKDEYFVEKKYKRFTEQPETDVNIDLDLEINLEHLILTTWDVRKRDYISLLLTQNFENPTPICLVKRSSDHS